MKKRLIILVAIILILGCGGYKFGRVEKTGTTTVTTVTTSSHNMYHEYKTDSVTTVKKNKK
jgi:uncharacterized protein YxeA